MAMDRLLEEVSRLHFPRPPATTEQLSAFEVRVGWKLDPDLRAFYLHCDGCTLFETLPDAKYRVLPLTEIQHARRAIRASDEEEDGAASQYTLVDMQDTNYVVLDVAQAANGHYPLFDAFHETYPETERIASSFEEFLERALRSGDRAYWLISDPPEG
ncbi:SMI1/KNR4 family protein [Corallococcus terminator]|uniref:SMI1/KNR4 family protein n=1 Tax=Corallococcus terminator TaxID=2316733 RepID=A0A3A8I4U9_9BACT|nr:SMI1/KNR4 family protein [Corallococcus terminator]RKG77776.1 SMI1/KNR4 family protein [Corallococcus terminator]